VCREKLQERLYEVLRPGSPLRVQGKVLGFIYIEAYCRITPACAGKSHLLLSLPAASDGSPLRVQGKVTISSVLDGIDRITPACAGKSRYF